MRRLPAFLVLLVSALLLAGCGDDGGATAASGGGGSKGCTPGTTKNDGLEVVRHCGPATAEVEVGGDTHQLDEGSCEKTDDQFVLNVGDTVVDPDASQEERLSIDYLGIVVGNAAGTDADAGKAAGEDGTFTDAVISGAAGGEDITLITGSTLELTDDRSSGTFSGTNTAGDEVSGSFSCG